MGRVNATIARFAIATALCTAVVPLPSWAQGTLNDSLAGRIRGNGESRLLVEAKELVYDNDRNTVAARGDVELNYQGRTLQADRVTYDRGTGRVFAEGNARLTEANGAVITGDRFELTDDFKSGFIDSLRVVQQTDEGTTRFSAPRAERSEGETTTFERGTYTACEPCEKDPTRPPLWQVKAARIIHNNSERTIYYEDATLEFAGVPIAYVPYFWTPDPTERRRTGFLAPRYFASNALGTGIQVPFFWAIAPNYDLTFYPTLLTRQGFLGQAEWRHRLLNGAYTIRTAGIFQQDPDAFLPGPLGAREKDFRGSVETTGRFHINENWTWGWDVAVLSDKWFLQNYRIRSESVEATYAGFKESISTVFLQGRGDRSWFDVRGYYFRTLSAYDWQKQQPVVHPVLDYEKRINGPQPLGGEVKFEVNATSLSRDAAAFQQIPNQTAYLISPSVLGTNYSLIETCSVFQAGRCLVRGISGNASRASAQLSWRRQFIDPIGQLWTPFAYARGDVIGFDPDFRGYQNPELQRFITNGEVVGRGMAGVGLEYRFPLVADIGNWGTQTLEPIAQIVARPNEARIGRLPNEDAQSLVFDDSNLFEWDKFSGYDRVEGGVRANVGLQYHVTGDNGFYANALFGKSINLAGRNSFSIGDLVNVGRDSGLDTDESDYVARLQIQPTSGLSFITRGRFDEGDFSLRRFEAGMMGSFNPLLPVSASVIYARYMPQPELGYIDRREGISASATVNLTPNWFVTGSVLVDLDRYLQARETFVNTYLANPATAIYDRADHWQVASSTIGFGYADECTVFSINYSITPRTLDTGEKERTQTVMLRLELRTLGAVNVRQNVVGEGTSQDGLTAR